MTIELKPIKIYDRNPMEFLERSLPELDEYLQGKAIKTAAMGNDILVFAEEKAAYPSFYKFKANRVFHPSIDDAINREIGKSEITALDVSPCGTYAVTGYSGGLLILWDTKLGVHISSINGSEGKPCEISHVSIQHDCTAFIAATTAGCIQRIVMKPLMGYMTVYKDYSRQYDANIKTVKTASTCDSSRHLFVVAFPKKVIIMESGNEVTELNSISVDQPIVAFDCKDWHFHLAIGSHCDVEITEIGEKKEMIRTGIDKYPHEIESVGFVNPGVLATIVNNEVVVRHISGKYDSKSVISHVNKNIITGNGKIVVLPDKMYVFENWRDRMEKLASGAKYVDAIRFGMKLFVGDATGFECHVSERDHLKTMIWDCVLAYLSKCEEDPAQLLEVADAVVKSDLGEKLLNNEFQLLREDIRHQMIIALLDATSKRCDLGPRVVRMAVALQNIEKSVLERELMKMSLPPSFTKEAIEIAKEHRLFLFAIHHFYSVYDNILPVFAFAVENCELDDLARVCCNVFKDFEFQQVTNCVVWLFSDSKRLYRCFESDWDMAPSHLQLFLDKAPIVFSHVQSLSRKEMIGVALVSFANAPKGRADGLFELLATEALDSGVPIPSESISNILSFLFDSDVSRKLRESLFMRIIDKDYAGEMILEDYLYACVGVGFSSAVKRLYESNEIRDCEPLITSMLLSDTPEDAYDFLENVTSEVHKNAESAIVTRFRILLFLNSKRFVKLVIEKFPDLHPTTIQSMTDTAAVIRYYDGLFENVQFSEGDDAHFYLNYLADHSVTDLINFLREKEVKSEWIYDMCKSKKLSIVCAVIDSMKNNWNFAFQNYRDHLSRNDSFEHKLSIELLDHISELEEEPVHVIRTVMHPIVTGDANSSLVRAMIDHVTKKIDSFIVLTAIVPLAVNCRNPQNKAELVSFMNKEGCCCHVDPKANPRLIDVINHITEQSRGKKLHQKGLTAQCDSDGVTLISTMDDSEDACEVMGADLSKEVQYALQRAESFFGANGNRVPQDEEATVVLMIGPSK